MIDDKRLAKAREHHKKATTVDWQAATIGSPLSVETWNIVEKLIEHARDFDGVFLVDCGLQQQRGVKNNQQKIYLLELTFTNAYQYCDFMEEMEERESAK